MVRAGRCLAQAFLLWASAASLSVRQSQNEAQGTEAPSTVAAPVTAGDGGRYAFVMMAFDPPGTAPRSLWGVLPMAHAVRKLSNYPLVVLTNATSFPDGSDVAASFARLGVQVLPVKPVPVPEALLHEHRRMPCQMVDPPVCQYQFLKLQIWTLTQFDRLIWMDSDSILTRSVDTLFSLPGTWAQQDNWDCGSTLSFLTRVSGTLTRAVDWLQREFPSTPSRDQSSGICSGFLVLEPSMHTYEAMVSYMNTLDSAPGGDQQIVEDYFKQVRHSPVQLLDVTNASFGQCIGKAIPGGGLPAFVHKSSWENECFQLGAGAAACSAEPLGRYWHEHFCNATAAAQLVGKDLRRFCAAWL